MLKQTAGELCSRGCDQPNEHPSGELSSKVKLFKRLASDHRVAVVDAKRYGHGAKTAQRLVILECRLPTADSASSGSTQSAPYFTVYNRVEHCAMDWDAEDLLT